mmetsp:Transcript_10590/g.17335  ORF Transcript_10590/g.17335 Transcript_10590/m.17335 type:complete len:299 (+) Transcript_10590:745-1641(+)
MSAKRSPRRLPLYRTTGFEGSYQLPWISLMSSCRYPAFCGSPSWFCWTHPCSRLLLLSSAMMQWAIVGSASKGEDICALVAPAAAISMPASTLRPAPVYAKVFVEQRKRFARIRILYANTCSSSLYSDAFNQSGASFFPCLSSRGFLFDSHVSRGRGNSSCTKRPCHDWPNGSTPGSIACTCLRTFKRSGRSCCLSLNMPRFGASSVCCWELWGCKRCAITVAGISISRLESPWSLNCNIQVVFIVSPPRQKISTFNSKVPQPVQLNSKFCPRRVCMGFLKVGCNVTIASSMNSTGFK